MKKSIITPCHHSIIKLHESVRQQISPTAVSLHWIIFQLGDVNSSSSERLTFWALVSLGVLILILSHALISLWTVNFPNTTASSLAIIARIWFTVLYFCLINLLVYYFFCPSLFWFSSSFLFVYCSRRLYISVIDREKKVEEKIQCFTIEKAY